MAAEKKERESKKRRTTILAGHWEDISRNLLPESYRAMLSTSCLCLFYDKPSSMTEHKLNYTSESSREIYIDRLLFYPNCQKINKNTCSNLRRHLPPPPALPGRPRVLLNLRAQLIIWYLLELRRYLHIDISFKLHKTFARIKTCLLEMKRQLLDARFELNGDLAYVDESFCLGGRNASCRVCVGWLGFWIICTLY